MDIFVFLERVDVYLQYTKSLGTNMFWIHYSANAFNRAICDLTWPKIHINTCI